VSAHTQTRIVFEKHVPWLVRISHFLIIRRIRMKWSWDSVVISLHLIFLSLSLAEIDFCIRRKTQLNHDKDADMKSLKAWKVRDSCWCKWIKWIAFIYFGIFTFCCFIAQVIGLKLCVNSSLSSLALLKLSVQALYMLSDFPIIQNKHFLLLSCTQEGLWQICSSPLGLLLICSVVRASRLSRGYC